MKMVRGCWLACLVVLLSGLRLPLFAQSERASLSGRITDPNGAVVPHATVEAVQNDTNTKITTESNGDGLYYFAALQPATYRIVVSKDGFLQVIQANVLLHVQDELTLNFALRIGSVSETVTITAEAPLLNTTDAAVSTVIDRNFVDNLPLNGRSFNTLLQLTPGVVIAEGSSWANNQGQFSISGQRTSANNFLVDGVSANFGVSPTFGLGTSGTGAAQAFSALGGTSSLVSVEALQEFRIETSSFAPEFGRSPGGQVALTTRSGTNDLHGSVYEYFRNTVMDANDWFANQAGEPRAAENHSDFGGNVGGPIVRDRTFFFASYEGARLREPDTTIVQVPSEYARSVAPPSIAPFLLAYPNPTDKTVVPGVYTGNFIGNYSNPSTLNAGSIRIDHTFNDRFTLFGRYNEAPSQSAARNNSLAEVDTTEVDTRTLTVGSTMLFSPVITNVVRGNYSLQNASLVLSLDNFGGAVPPSLSVLGPNLANPSKAYFAFYTYDTSYYSTGPDTRNSDTQLNFVDDLSVTHGAHQWKFGGDYRTLFLDVRPFESGLEYIASSVPDFLSTGQVLLFPSANNQSQFLSRALSLYGQDTWRISPRFTITYGLRWELNPAPSARGNTILAAWQNVNDPSGIALAPKGTRLWNTTYTNFAPRIGVAYSPDGSLVLRAGFGIFYDLGSDTAGYLAAYFPNSASTCCPSVTLPLADSSSYIPVTSTQPPYNDAWGFSPNLVLPRSYQWNAAVEKSFLGKQSMSLTYVGQAGRDLLRQEEIAQPNANFAGPFTLTENQARSNYNALQVQYRRPVAAGLQAIVNYTFSHALDNASNDIYAAVSKSVISAANDYASSDFDARHSFSAAVNYVIPSVGKERVLSLLTRDWSTDAVIVVRSGFPFNAEVLTATINGAYPRPDLVAGQPIWIANIDAGAGKSLNPAAFTVPAAGVQGTEGRNDIRGFGLTQFDLSIARKITLTDRWNLQFRTDAFNVFNHPNFRNPYAYIGYGPTYLSSPSMLNHGLGGLSPLFQEGGPRSLQVSLKLSF